ncbi:MAG: hypothetical protein HZA54_19950, partial [Planctomycetes bacterium]|nr:hypothetical protein [Planctomycetota bacterium]
MNGEAGSRAERARRWVPALCGALALAAGLLLRLEGLTERGAAFFDEGVYLAEGRYLAGAVRALP